MTEELPPEEERISLREAAQFFDPPTTKKALESLIQRGQLKVWREPPTPARPDRASRVVTTRAALQAYADSPSARRRLRAEGEPPASSVEAMHVGWSGTPWVGGDPLALVHRDLTSALLEIRIQLQQLRQAVEALERKLG